MRKIAILRCSDIDDYDYGHKVIIESITDWTEVTNEQYDEVQKWINSQYRYHTVDRLRLVEQVTERSPEMSLTDILASAHQFAKQEKKAAADRKKREADRAAQKAEKDRERKMRQLAKLKKELGEQEEV